MHDEILKIVKHEEVEFHIITFSDEIKTIYKEFINNDNSAGPSLRIEIICSCQEFINNDNNPDNNIHGCKHIEKAKKFIEEYENEESDDEDE